MAITIAKLAEKAITFIPTTQGNREALVTVSNYA